MHCRELQSKPEWFHIFAGCDPLPERLDNLRRTFGSKTYERIEDLVEDEEVELVVIASRSSDHLSHGLIALSAGKDILLEKPMTLHLKEAEQLAETADRLGRSLYVRHNRRFDPDFLHVCEIMESGILGEVILIKLYRHSFQRRNDWQTLKEFGGGQLLNWGPHIIDHALRLMQATARLKWSHLDQVQAAGDAEDHLKLILEGDNGRVIDIEISGGMAISAPAYQLYGTRGSLVLTGTEIQLKYIRTDMPLLALEADPGTPGQSFGRTGTFKAADDVEWIEETIPVKPAHPIDFWEALYHSIRLGEPFHITTDEALSVVEIITEAKRNTRFA